MRGLLLLVILLLPAAEAQTLAPAPVQASPSPTTFGVPDARVVRDITYVPNGGPRQRLDLYLPVQAGPPRPLIVWIHGGGWQAGSKDQCPARLFVPLGYAAASVEYRFSQDAPFPAQIEDCKAAIRWLARARGGFRDRPDPRRRLGGIRWRAPGGAAGRHRPDAAIRRRLVPRSVERGPVCR